MKCPGYVGHTIQDPTFAHRGLVLKVEDTRCTRQHTQVPVSAVGAKLSARAIQISKAALVQQNTYPKSSFPISLDIQ